MEEIVRIFGAASLVVLWVVSEPTIRLRVRVGLDGNADGAVMAFLGRLMSCSVCIGTWFALGLALSRALTPWEAACVPVAAEFITRKLSSIEI
jgi:hypothetical protein